ncbi:alcohol dehydrogenase catalytic domain-containing protein [Streptomyces sp. FT1]|uniref:alcohol dehydrogenase catalytic domain-containing protein n=1 Tax=Streptomyces sp. FT1 TaxID=2871486 RepID=UPI003A4C65EB
MDVHGGPEVLTVREVPEPVCGPGEVLVRTVASSLNPVDWKTRAWEETGPALPATLGWDLAGIVVASRAPGFAPGDRILAMSAQIATGLGTWAELVALPQRLLTPAPATLSLVEAAALPLAGTAAVQAVAALRPRPGVAAPGRLRRRARHRRGGPLREPHRGRPLRLRGRHPAPRRAERGQELRPGEQHGSGPGGGTGRRGRAAGEGSPSTIRSGGSARPTSGSRRAGCRGRWCCCSEAGAVATRRHVTTGRRRGPFP